MKVRAVPCPMCGMPPQVDSGPDYDDGFFYVVCHNFGDGCPKQSVWCPNRDEACLEWNRSVVSVIYWQGRSEEDE
jgi:hypothetical protein